MFDSCRIEKNPRLCYTATISWRHILSSGFDYRRIQQNRPNIDCVDVCPVDDRCPTAEVAGRSHVRQVCWSEKHCQKSK